MTAPLFWLSAGGGVGTTTLQRCCGIGLEVSSQRVSTGVVVVVCRSNARSLMKAQQTAGRHADNSPSLLDVLVVVADAPGRLPRPLEDLARLVSGAYANSHRIPWWEPWRLGEARDLRTAPKQVRVLAEELVFACDHHKPPAACQDPIEAPQLATSASFNNHK